MTIQEMHDLWDVLRDFYKAPYYEGEEKDFFINSAIHAFVVGTIPSGENRKAKVGGQKKLDQISSLITTSKKLTAALDTTSAVKDVVEIACASFDKPADFWFYSSLTCIIGSTKPEVNIVDFDELSSIPSDSFNGVSDKIVRLCFIENKIYIISTTPPTSLILYYIKHPAKVSLSAPTQCNLPSSTHDRIVHMAVQLSCPGSNLMEMYKAQENEIQKR